MKRTAGSTIVLLSLLPTLPSAHRLDEYLQATRVTVARERIEVAIDLTPGIRVAAEIISTIDRDGSGRITSHEADTYGRAALTETVLVVDGQAMPLTLNRIHVPAIAMMREGLGTIRIDASAPTPSRAPGRHEVSYRNNHRPEVSTYAVNALMPDTSAVSIVAQGRDMRQREFHLRYDVAGRTSTVGWSMAAVLGMAALALARRMNIPRRSAG